MSFSDWDAGIGETEYAGGNSEGIPYLNRLSTNSPVEDGGQTRAWIQTMTSSLRTWASHTSSPRTKNFAGKVLPFVSIRVAMRVKCNGGTTNTFAPPGAYMKVKGPVAMAAAAEKKMCGYMAGVRRMSSTTLQYHILQGSGATGVANNIITSFGSAFAHNTVLRLRFDVESLGAAGDYLSLYSSPDGPASENWILIGSTTIASTSPYYIPWGDGMTTGLCGSYNGTTTIAETHLSNFRILTGTKG